MQAINDEFLKKVIVRRQLLPRNFELRGGEVQNFVYRLLFGWHWLLAFMADTAARRCSPQTFSMRLRRLVAHTNRKQSQSRGATHHTESVYRTSWRQQRYGGLTFQSAARAHRQTPTHRLPLPPPHT